MVDVVCLIRVRLHLIVADSGIKVVGCGVGAGVVIMKNGGKTVVFAVVVAIVVVVDTVVVVVVEGG